MSFKGRKSVTAPPRVLTSSWRGVSWSLFLLLAVALFALADVLVIRYSCSFAGFGASPSWKSLLNSSKSDSELKPAPPLVEASFETSQKPAPPPVEASYETSQKPPAPDEATDEIGPLAGADPQGMDEAADVREMSEVADVREMSEAANVREMGEAADVREMGEAADVREMGEANLGIIEEADPGEIDEVDPRGISESTQKPDRGEIIEEADPRAIDEADMRGMDERGADRLRYPGRKRVKGFVGVHTGFKNGRRRALLRETWFPATPEEHARAEATLGLVFRFIVGHGDAEECDMSRALPAPLSPSTSSAIRLFPSAEATLGLVFRFIVGHGRSVEDEEMLQAENSTHGDFLRIDVQESYLNLNRKTDGDERGSHDGDERGSHDGDERGLHDGDERGSHDGDVRGSHDGAVRGSHDGDVRGSHDGDVRGSHDGDVRGSHDGDVRGSHDGDVRGSHDGDVRGSHDGDVRGSHDGDSRVLHYTLQVLLAPVPSCPPLPHPPSPSLVYFTTLFKLYEVEFYVKADDDIYLIPDRLSSLIARPRNSSRTYIGCMKRGTVGTNPDMKWYERKSWLLGLGYERKSWLLGSHYFMHAFGAIYALSYDVVNILNAIPDDGLSMFTNEDVSVGAWMLAFDVQHEKSYALCQKNCTPSAVALWEPICAGLCRP
ncbi:unnamed protein product, partial [Closterium sp. NIES-64]